ncbi:MAG: hypothetical protein ACREWI_10995 [Telluria sp.]
MIGACPPATQLVLDILRQELAGEPCIEEKKDWALKFFGHPKQSAYSRKRKERVGRDPDGIRRFPT